tara:strand:+ start:32 stop:424 length:393 start_codon:yes stop_codon:yes gene_type:complete
MKTSLKKLVKDINAENAPPDGWTKQDQLHKVKKLRDGWYSFSDLNQSKNYIKIDSLRCGTDRKAINQAKRILKDKHANVVILEDKPEEGKVYALTGGPGSRCIANGNSWAESEVTDADPAAGHADDRGTS